MFKELKTRQYLKIADLNIIDWRMESQLKHIYLMYSAWPSGQFVCYKSHGIIEKFATKLFPRRNNEIEGKL